MGNGFRSNLPVVSNLTAMNLWDAVCMGFIYTSFLEFVVVNYLARWVQDPEIQKRKRDNAILDSLRIVTTTLDLKHPEKAGTLGAGLFHLDAGVKNKLSQVKQRIPGDGSNEDQQKGSGMSEDSAMTMISDKYEEESLSHHIHQSISEEPKGYSLIQVKKIDVYSRRIFPILFFI